MRAAPPLLIALVALACGPSFQRVYEGDVKFEHCYATDESAVATPEAKRSCWNEWREHYTYGQSRDRIDYAADRYALLGRGPNDSHAEQLVAEAAPSRTVAAPVPTSAFAPPPNMLPSADPAKAPPPRLRAPKAACSNGCLSTWEGCKEGCKGKSCDTCDRKYDQCVPQCFREEGKHATR